MMQLVPPTAGRVTQSFGPAAAAVASREPEGYFVSDKGGYLKAAAYQYPGSTYNAHFHRAVDIAAPLGTPILAGADGTVVRRAVSSPDGAWYMAVEVAPGIRTYDWHLSAFLVNLGDKVKRGQAIALMGSTGNSTGSHDHAEVRAGSYTAPTFYNPARLWEGGDLAIHDGAIVPMTQGVTAMSYALRVREFDTPKTFTLAPGKVLSFYDPDKPGKPVYNAVFPMEFTGQVTGTASVNWRNLGNSPRPIPDSGGNFNFSEVGDVTPYPAGGVATDTYRGLLVVTATDGFTVAP